MAIVHVAFKSSSQAPPAAAHAQYLARDGEYARRGGLEMLESGNMPRFAEADPHSFWVAADAHERANGRTYTEVQVALPRELSVEQRQELARETARELLGDRFAYTLAVHTPLAKDNIDQPHLHLMFSERAVTDQTRELGEDRFFKRNGAKKDPAWNDRNKPEEVRAKWVEMMNGAMQKAGIDQQLDPRSWEEQGRSDLAELREEKTLHGHGREAQGRYQEIHTLRELRAELPAAGLDREAAIAVVEKMGERQVAAVQEREQQELSRLDRLIAAARELAIEVKERTVAVARQVTGNVESFFQRLKRESGIEPAHAKEPEQVRPPTPSVEERLAQKLAGLDTKLDAQESLADRLAGFERRMDEQTKVQQEAQQKEVSKEQEAEQSHSHSRGFGIEM